VPYLDVDAMAERLGILGRRDTAVRLTAHILKDREESGGGIVPRVPITPRQG